MKKRTLLWLIALAALVLGVAIYRARSGPHFNVTPEAQREIEKAMHR